jgi:hypothetical protein
MKSNAGNRKPKAHTDVCPWGEAIVYRFYWVALGWGSELQLLLMADKSENLGEVYLYCECTRFDHSFTGNSISPLKSSSTIFLSVESRTSLLLFSILEM